MTYEIAELFALISLIGIVFLIFFCAVKPHIGIASFFYFLVGLAIIPPVIYWYQIDHIDTTQLIVALFMDGAFFLGGVISFRLFLKARAEKRLAEANKAWQQQSIRQGKRRIFKYLIKR